MITRWMTAHPASVGESYVSHLGFALRFGATMVLGGLACMVHGVLPFCLTTSGSRRVRALHGMLHETGEPAGLDAFNWSI